jgi:phage gp29-like protein
MADGLFMPDGTFQPFSAEDLGTELATRQNAGVFFGDLDGWLATLPDPDPVLRRRGDDAEVLREISADDQVTTAMLSRKNRVLNSRHFSLRAGAPEGEQPTPEAEELYRRFMRDLEHTNLRSVISGMLDAPYYGFTPLELVWRYDGDWWHIVDIVARPYHWFRFDSRNHPVFVGEYGALCADPRPLPPGKFVFVSHHATYDNPYGLRLLSRCLWPVSFKRGGVSFYARFVERHGMPWVVGKAPSRASEEDKRKIARGLSRMVQDAVAVVPFGAEVKLESAGQTQGAIHEAFLARQDKAISKVLMGQTLTVEMEGKNSQAAAQTHAEVAGGLADADKAMVTDAWNEITWLYAQVNAAPGVLAPLAAYEEPEDLNVQADLDKKLSDIGVEFTEEHFTEKYGLKPGAFRVRSAVSAGPTSLEFSAPKKAGELVEKARKRLDAAITDLLPVALKASRVLVAEVENAVDKAESFDELEASLVDLLAPSMRPDALESFLASAMTAAAGHGASAVQKETEEDA